MSPQKLPGPCAVNSCPEMATCGARCATHRREQEQRRGTRQQRGYDTDYDRAKRDPAYMGATTCDTCGGLFTADNPKTAGHRVAIRKGGKGSGIKPECRRCNYGWVRSGT